MGPRLVKQLRQPGMLKMLEKDGLGESGVDEIEAALKAWTQRPDAFFALMFCESVGWLPA